MYAPHSKVCLIAMVNAVDDGQRPTYGDHAHWLRKIGSLMLIYFSKHSLI